MNIQDYIDSGILHDYCLGILSADEQAAVEKMCTMYPLIKEELERIDDGMRKYTETNAQWPDPAIQQTIWNTLDNINKEKAGNLHDLPLLNKYSDYNNWKRIVQPFMPAKITEERTTKPFRVSGGVTQVLIISKTDVAEEVHEQERESFIVLEGECECHIGDDVVRLGPGGFIEIPLHVPHNVKILSPYVVAVLQHIAI